MKLHQLRDVLAVAETGSLRAAGRRMGLTQPTISRSIRDIEHELGAPLFERHGNGTRLTSIGEAFVRRAKIVQSELRRAADEVEQLKGEFVGQVAVSMSPGSTIALMPSILRNFRKKHPKIVLKISEGVYEQVEADLLSGDIDFFIGPVDQDVQVLPTHVEKLFNNQRVVVARKGHPLGNATTLADLAGAEWIKPTFATRSGEADLDAMFEHAGMPAPNIVLHTRSALMTLLAVESTDLLTILPVQWLEISATSEGVQPLWLSDNLYSAPICVVRRIDVPLTPAAESLWSLTVRAGLNYKPIWKA